MHVERCLSRPRSRTCSRRSRGKVDNESEEEDDQKEGEDDCVDDDVLFRPLDESGEEKADSPSVNSASDVAVPRKRQRQEKRRASKKGRVGEAVIAMNDDWEEKAFSKRTGEGIADAGIIATDFVAKAYGLSWNRLFDYQREGVKWMFGLYKAGIGGILGDEMGIALYDGCSLV
jgi:SNF2 family DNA or RNA helicase